MKHRTTRAAAIGALLVVTTSLTFAPRASAQTGRIPSERYGGAAQAAAAAFTIDGQRVTVASGTAGGEIDPARRDNPLSAAGIGSDATPETMVGASGEGDDRQGCAVPQLGLLRLHLETVCGTARISGGGMNFSAVGAGRAGAAEVSGGDLLDQLPTSALQPILDDTLGNLADLPVDLPVQPKVDPEAEAEEAQETAEATVDEKVDPLTATAVGLVNAKLDELVGEKLPALVGDASVPGLDASDTLGDLLDRLNNAPLVRLVLGEGTGEVGGDSAVLTSRAADDGATLEILPGVLPDGTPLATVRVSASAAVVVYDRAKGVSDGSSQNVEVVVESPLLDRAETVPPGESIKLFCDGPADEVAVLCTEISVGSPSERIVNGRLQVQASLVTVHVAKGLDLPDVPSVPGLDDVLSGLPVELPDQARDVLGTVAGLIEGLDLPVVGSATGSSTGTKGVRIDLAGATAQAGGAKVLGSSTRVSGAPGQPPFTGALPRTGAAEALPMLGTAFLLGGAGFRRLLGRRAR